MLIAKKVKKTKLHTVTYMQSDVTGEMWLHFNRNDGTNSYLIKQSEVGNSDE